MNSAKEKGIIPMSLQFIGQTRVTCVNEKILKTAVMAGLRVISFGVESFSDASLTALDLQKGFSAKDAFDIVSTSLKVGVPVTNVNLILFHPTITIEAGNVLFNTF